MPEPKDIKEPSSNAAVPNIMFGPPQGDDTDYEFVVSDEPLEDELGNDPNSKLTKEDLALQLQKERDRIKELENQANLNAALSQSISQLGMNLNQPRVEEVDPIKASLAQIQGQGGEQSFLQRQTGESLEDYNNRIKEEYYNDPVKASEILHAQKMAPLVTQMMTMNLTNSKMRLELDPDKRDTYKRYKAEIDKYVADLEPRLKFQDPEIFLKAHDQVVARHINDIIQEKVQQAIEQATKQAVNQQPTVDPPAASFLETTQRPAYQSSPTPKKIRLTSEQEAHRKAKGMTELDYWKWLQRRKGGA